MVHIFEKLTISHKLDTIEYVNKHATMALSNFVSISFLIHSHNLLVANLSFVLYPVILLIAKFFLRRYSISY